MFDHKAVSLTYSAVTIRNQSSLFTQNCKESIWVTLEHAISYYA
jgi:hypothetical protein